MHLINKTMHVWVMKSKHFDNKLACNKWQKKSYLYDFALTEICRSFVITSSYNATHHNDESPRPLSIHIINFLLPWRKVF